MSNVLTLKAAGLVDVDAGVIIRPGIVRVSGDRIIAVGPAEGGEELDDLAGVEREFQNA